MSERKLNNRLGALMGQIDRLRNRYGKEVAVDFRKLPPRTGTDYYKFIVKPISLHTIARNVKKGAYVSAQQFIDDLAQVTWNARHYNEPSLAIYDNAIILDNFIKEVVLPKLTSDKQVPNHELLYYPDLGPLEDYSHVEANRTADIGDEDELYYTEGKSSSAGTRSGREASHTPRMELGVKRGRPPIIDKPYESRIKLILKQFKKLRHPQDENYPLAAPFEKLPDKSLDAYYRVVAVPISLNEIRIKVRARKYQNVDQFLEDLNLMLTNAKAYYSAVGDQEGFADVEIFETQANAVIQQELSKPESELIEASADGFKTPLDLVEVRGYTYKIGDWVLIRNPNDPQKPTAGQIFRLWLTEDGTKYTNVCWYIRPEQTCHRVDRLFFQNEVCKTGEYRDHLAEDIELPCYVIFLTHWQKGDIPPELAPPGSPWFICEFRYNNTTYVFNRIRTWKACLPDEIRGQDQPIIPISEARKLIKYESPIKHLLPADAHIGMPVPAATPGPSPNGPPVVGLVYLAPPFPNDELGQLTLSQHVSPIPEFDDPSTGRKAYLFTPISQLKGGGGGATTTTAYMPGTVSSGMSPLAASYDDPHDYNYQPPYAAPTVPQYQFTQHKFSTPEPSRRTYTPPTDYTIGPTKNYGTGPLAFTLGDDEDEDEDEESHDEDEPPLLDLSANFPDKPVWFRGPPLSVASRIDTPVPLGHSAKYLAWKAENRV